MHQWPDRRLFLQVMAALAGSPSALTGVPMSQARQDLPFHFDLPAGATLWGYVGFVGDRLIEIIVEGRSTTSVRGRFDGKRLQEFSYANRTNAAQRVTISARRVGEDAMIPFTALMGLGHGNEMISFGYRPLAQDASQRDGVYSYEAVLTMFTVYT